MQWHKVELSHDKIAWGTQWKRIQDQFTEIMIKKGFPEDAALFSGEGTGDTFSILYFSPAASTIVGNIISEYYGVACDKPAKDKTSLLVGNGASMELLSPDYD